MTEDDPQGRDVGRLLLELGPRLALIQRHVLGELHPPLSYRQYRTLYQIARGRTTLTALRARATVGLSTLSEIVDHLVRRELVERTPSERDRRTADLALTRAGEALLAEAEQRLDVLAARFIEGLPPDDQGQLAEALSPLNARARELLAEHHSDPKGHGK